MSAKVSLKNYSTYGVENYCRQLYLPKNNSEFISLLRNLDLKKERYKVIGNGSNILFHTKCKNCSIICTRDIKKQKSRNGDILTFSASNTLCSAYLYAKSNELSGFEKLALIPGTIGGAIAVNASAFGVQIFDLLHSVQVYHNGEVITLTKKDFEYGYRFTNIREKGYIILSAKFLLKHDKISEIEKRYKECLSFRRTEQPLGRCAGSVFKNPPAHYAGKLIESCKLKGVSCNDAFISTKHANFIVNRSNAKSSDILKLIKLCKHKVYKQYKIKLEPEVEIF